MANRNKHLRATLVGSLFLAGTMLAPEIARAQLKQPLLSEDNLKKVSDHVYVIEGFPNVAIVVGSRATLVVDTGLGERNGATVIRAEQKVAKGSLLYLTTTHYHSEHTAGESAFPAGTIIVRNIAQQQEMDKGVAAHIEVFKKMSDQNMSLLQDVKSRAPDVVFDREAKLDLGGVTARLFWIGPAHTKGDELTFVEESSPHPRRHRSERDFPDHAQSRCQFKGWSRSWTASRPYTEIRRPPRPRRSYRRRVADRSATRLFARRTIARSGIKKARHRRGRSGENSHRGVKSKISRLAQPK